MRPGDLARIQQRLLERFVRGPAGNRVWRRRLVGLGLRDLLLHPAQQLGRLLRVAAGERFGYGFHARLVAQHLGRAVQRFARGCRVEPDLLNRILGLRQRAAALLRAGLHALEGLQRLLELAGRLAVGQGVGERTQRAHLLLLGRAERAGRAARAPAGASGAADHSTTSATTARASAPSAGAGTRNGIRRAGSSARAVRAARSSWAPTQSEPGSACMNQ